MSKHKKSHIVFNLIKAMTSAEKRYFKMYISVFESKNKTYLKLYNAIDKQTKYDEKALKEKFKDESFSKHFAVVKSNLYTMILKSLRFYHSKDDAVEKMNLYFAAIKILMQKGLYDQAKLQLEKAMKFAKESELLIEQLKVSELKISTDTYLHLKNHKNKPPDFSLEEPLICLERVKDSMNYQYLTSYLDFIILRNEIRTIEAQNELKNILKKDILQNNYLPLSVEGLNSKFHAKLACYVSIKSYEMAYSEAKSLYELTLTEKYFYKHTPFNVVGICNNYLYTAIRTQSLTELKKISKTYKTLLVKTKKEFSGVHDFEGRLFDANYNCIMEYHFHHISFEKLRPLLPEMEKSFEEIKPKCSPFLYILYSYNIAYTHFGIGNIEKAQDYIVDLLNYDQLKSRKDYNGAVHILNLFIHLEMDNEEYLSYQIKNSKNILIRQNYFYNFEKSIIEFISGFYKIKSIKNKLISLKKYQVLFKELSTQSCEIDAFEKFNISWWIDKRIQKTEKEI